MRSLLALLCLACPALAAELPKGPPNIVIILADDLGYADVGYQGCVDIETPNIDALAKGGIVFTSGYSSHPFCSPMRAGLMSGRYQQRFGYETNIPYAPQNDVVGLDKKQPTITTRLQKVGYLTGGVGKWHLGASHSFHPLKRGFDHYYGFLGGGHDYFDVDLSRPLGEGYRDALQRDGKPEGLDGYLTDRLTDAAVDFIEKAAKGEEPFFLYLGYNAPHTPMQAPEEWLEKYKGIEDEKRRAYAAMVSSMDEGIGEVMNALEANEVWANTLVFFLSDNGGPEKSNASDNGSLRGQKGDLYEGGVRVPFLAYWPAGLLDFGKKYHAPVNSLDAACTALALAGINISNPDQFDGVNLIPYLTGKEGGDPHEYLYWRKNSGAGKAIRGGRWKLLQFENGPPQLYDVEADIGETEDVAADHLNVVKILTREWEKWDADNIPSRLPGFRDYHPAMHKVHREMVGDSP